MKIAIVDKLGLCYDGNTIKKQGLGGSESAVILISEELVKLGFEVTVYNNCRDVKSSPGVYNGVTYIDNTDANLDRDVHYDVVIVSRTALPFLTNQWPFIHTAKKRVLWLHDTFIEGDDIVEDLVISGKIDHIFTLSDWHTSYILTCDHGKKRNYEVLKKSVFQTRNGAVCHIPEVDVGQKDPNHFVYNASATKGMIPLIEDIWPRIREHLPEAKLTVIGGYYRFRENSAPDAQESTVREFSSRKDLEDVGITFTGIIPQHEIAQILSNAWMMLYPGAFPETFGISTLESLLYKTPLVTTRFGALEETAIDLACYHIDYAIEPNGLFPQIDKETQVNNFVETFISAYHNPYLHQQKQSYCDVIRDVAGWDTVALQWKQFFYWILGKHLPVHEYRNVTRINDKVSRVFGRTTVMPRYSEYKSYGPEKRIVVVSPFWNCSQFIEKHIASVASQDYDNYIHILIDDCSTDDSINVVKSLIDPKKCILIQNNENRGAIQNQLTAIADYARDDDIVMLLDGDDWLINNNTVFQYYNDLYSRGYEFTYGSMWSVADNIPLIAQDYSLATKQSRSYRKHHFNWKIPYTHLRTCLGKHFTKLDEDRFKVNGVWMKSGADNPLFYELIERVEPDRIYCNKEIVCIYNDSNPLNDYKVRTTEQNVNANLSYEIRSDNMSDKKKILVAIPTSKYIEVETFKSLWDLDVPDGYELDFQSFYGYSISQVRNLISQWAKSYDYLFSVDSDIVVPKDALTKMINADKDIISGLYIQRIPNTHTLEVYMDTPNGGCTNIPFNLLKDLDVVEIAACGMGCTLIKGEVFRKMDYPHFFYKEALTHEETVSEDVFFCLKARDYGFKVWADVSIKCDHKGSTFFKVVEEQTNQIEKIASLDLLPKEHADYLKNGKIDAPKVIYDLGSSTLHWTKKAKEVWPDAKYYLVDGTPSTEILYKEYDYASVVLSDVDGKIVDFYEKPDNPAGNSYYMETTGEYSDEDRKRRTSITLDTLAKTNQWLSPDLIKMDLQGAELDVLKGGSKTLATCNDLIIEAQHQNYNNGAPLFSEIKEYLESIGFEFVSAITEGLVSGDYHFHKNDK